jgi:hypothetical protein
MRWLIARKNKPRQRLVCTSNDQGSLNRKLPRPDSEILDYVVPIVRRNHPSMTAGVRLAPFGSEPSKPIGVNNVSQKCADTVPEQEHAKSSPRVQRSAPHISDAITEQLRSVRDDSFVRV